MSFILNSPLTSPKVAIVLATYKPNFEFFKLQIESLKSQTYKNWNCWIVDDHSPQNFHIFMRNLIEGDDRFELKLFEENLNSFKNFERGLFLVPDNFDYISLSDQDDVWHHDKLSKMISYFESLPPDVLLLHSDLRVISAKGDEISKSCWSTEGRNIQNRFGSISDIQNLNSLIFSNVVTGCSSLFRRSLLNHALPFYSFKNKNELPYFHDHWLSCCSLVKGKVAIFPYATIDYRQHDNNVIGAAISSKKKSLLLEFADKAPLLIRKSLTSLQNKMILVQHLRNRFNEPKSKIWDHKFYLFLFTLVEIIKTPYLWRVGLQFHIGLLVSKNKPSNP